MNMKETWKPVTISGFTGIMMGAASTYGMQHLMNQGTEAAETSSQPAHDYDSMSFKEAFEAARDAQGPGGVFTWHGNLYNTYTAAEWDAKTNLQKQQFANQVAANSSEIAEADNMRENDGDVRIVGNNDIAQQNVPKENIQTASNEMEPEDVDVRIVGQGDVKLASGRIVTVEELEINGQRVAVIDMDRDGTPDYAMSDLNHNHQMDDGEVIDLHTGEELSFTNDDTDTSDILGILDA